MNESTEHFLAFCDFEYYKFPNPGPKQFLNILLEIMSQSIPTGYISPPPPPPPGNPRENFFERVNTGHPGNSFCLIPLPHGKNDGRILGDGAKFSRTPELPNSKKLLLKLAKNPLKLRKLRDSAT